MTLTEILNAIGRPKIADMFNVGLLPDGKADTIQELFDTFIKKRLPDEKVIRAWHELLKGYTKDLSKVSCCVRYGYQRGPKGGTPWGEVHDDALRRGWLTRNTTDEFEYFFTDNHFCTYTCKMALCGFIPTLDEFTEAFREHKFPYGFMYYLRNHPEVDGAVIEYGKNPGFSSNYKISHVFDAGASFMVNGKICNDAELSLLYYPLGHRDDFLKNPDRIRKMDISDEAKKVIVAKFLRLTHPFNYFLTPTTHPKLHVYDSAAGVEMNDIGEDSRLLYYMRNYLKGKYPDIYREFLAMTLWPEDPDTIYPDTGSEYIGMDYGPHLKGVTVTSATVSITPKAPKPTVKKSSISTGTSTKNDNKTPVFKLLNDLVDSGKMTPELVLKLSDNIFTQQTFGIPSTYSLLVKESDFAKLGCNEKKYYNPERLIIDGENYRVCSQWIPERIKKLKDWHDTL